MMSDFVCGANKPKLHTAGVNWGRDLAEPDLVADIRNVVAGDPSPDGKGTLGLCRGIEVGHIFQLGTKYSEAMQATYLDENGQHQVMTMGCYGIGVSRIVGAAIEQGFDAKGIIFPLSIAPFQVAIVAIGFERSEEVRQAANKLYEQLQAAGLEVLLDDRGERPGVMFADMELIGIPHRITMGDRGLKEGVVEYQARAGGEVQTVALAEVVPSLRPHAPVDPIGIGLAAAGLVIIEPAGAQIEEPLSASVRAGLQKAVSDSAPPRFDVRFETEGQRWLAEMSRRLQKQIPDADFRRNFLIAVQYEAKRAGLDPQLVLGLIQVESGSRSMPFPQPVQRFYASHAVLGAEHRHSRSGSVSSAYQPALWLHHTEALSGYGARKSVSCTKSVQR